MITGWKKLTKEQRQHLKEAGVHTNADWQTTRQAQKDMESMVPGSHACLECDRIERVLND